MPKLPELYVAVDVEADGPIPGPYRMISLGMAFTGHADLVGPAVWDGMFLHW